jgi:hypothetical protein
MFGITKCHQAAGLVGGFNKSNCIRQHGRLGVLAMRMVVPKGRIGGDAIAKEIACSGNNGFNSH